MAIAMLKETLKLKSFKQKKGGHMLLNRNHKVALHCGIARLAMYRVSLTQDVSDLEMITFNTEIVKTLLSKKLQPSSTLRDLAVLAIFASERFTY